MHSAAAVCSPTFSGPVLPMAVTVPPNPGNSGNGTPPTRDQMMTILKMEDKRYRTFFPNWSRHNNFISPRDLAKNGFFYFNDGDKVQCVFCLGIIGNWEPGDEVTSEHGRHFPRCPLVLGLPVGNQPSSLEDHRRQLERSSSDVQSRDNFHPFPQLSPITRGFDVAGLGRREIRPTAVPERGAVLTSRSSENLNVTLSSSNQRRPIEELGIQPNKRPMYPTMATEGERIATFTVHKWPAGLKQRPHELAAAGFFYQGKSDTVTCYQCGVHLEGWDPDDEPWTEHAKWIPDCQYVILTKGPDFITKAREAAVESFLKKYRSSREYNVVREMGVPARKLEKLVGNWHLERKPLPWKIEHIVEGLETLPKVDGEQDQDEEMADPQEQGACAAVPPPPSQMPTLAPSSKSSSFSDLSEESILKEGGKSEIVTCKVCLESEVQVVFLPCGHLCTCSKCSTMVRNCPICRGLIHAFVRTYLS